MNDRIFHKRLKRKSRDNSPLSVGRTVNGKTNPAAETHLLQVNIILNNRQLPVKYDFPFRCFQVITEQGTQRHNHFFCRFRRFQIRHAADYIQRVEQKMRIDLAFQKVQLHCFQLFLHLQTFQLFFMKQIQCFSFLFQNQNILQRGIFHLIKRPRQFSDFIFVLHFHVFHMEIIGRNPFGGFHEL